LPSSRLRIISSSYADDTRAKSALMGYGRSEDEW
jgi:hypothetical protein